MNILKYRIFIFFLILGMRTPVSSQVWRGLGTGADFNVEAFAVDSSNLLYVGGAFKHVNGMSANAIAVWDSIQWSTLGSNEEFKNGSTITSLTFFQGNLIAGGLFDSIGNQRVNNIAKWDGNQWQPIGIGFDNAVYDIAVYSNELYAAGNFFFSGPDTVRYLARWNGSNWEMAAPGLNNYVSTLVVYNNKLIIGGQFSRINGLNFTKVAAWDGLDWATVGIGFNNEVFILRNIHDTLYAGGNFTSIPGNNSNWISRYDGQNWIPMPYPTGGNNSVTDITWFNNHLFVSGYFNIPEDIGIFNGTSYDSICRAYGSISNMFVYKNELYVGGNFITISGVTTSCVARLNYVQLNDIEDVFLENKNLIYPNPATRGMNIFADLDYSKLKHLSSISIHSIDGKLIEQISTENQTLIFQNIMLAPSTYILKFSFDDGRIFTNRLIVLP